MKITFDLSEISNKGKTIPQSFRLNEHSIAKLDTLSKLLNATKTDIIENLILQSYEQVISKFSINKNGVENEK